MKISSTIASLLFVAFAADAMAATDRSYYVTELAPQHKFDVYNDGRNTFVQSVPGLIITGATADSDFFIVKGVPMSIRGFMNGKPITVMRGTPPVPKPVPPDPAAVNAQIKQLTAKLDSLSASVQPPAGATPTNAFAGLKSGNEQVWEIKSSDKTVFGAMKRWAKTAGWQLMWDTEGNDYPVIAEASYKGQFDVAVGGVMASLERSQYPLRACLYENRAVRVIHKTKRCEG